MAVNIRWPSTPSSSFTGDDDDSVSIWTQAQVVVSASAAAATTTPAGARRAVLSVPVHGRKVVSPTSHLFATPQSLDDIKWLDSRHSVALCDNDHVLLLPDTRPVVSDRVGLDHRLLSGPSLARRVSKGGHVAPHDSSLPLTMVVKLSVGLAPINEDVSRCLSASEENLARGRCQSPLPQRRYGQQGVATTATAAANSKATPPPPLLASKHSLMIMEDEDEEEEGWPGADGATIVPESPLTRPPRRLLVPSSTITATNGAGAGAGAGGHQSPEMPPPARRMKSPVISTVSPRVGGSGVRTEPLLMMSFGSDTDTLSSIDPRAVRWGAPRSHQQSANIILSRTPDGKGGDEFILFALTLDTKTGVMQFQVTSQMADYNLPWTTIPERLTDADGGSAAPMDIFIGLMEDGVVSVSVSGVLLSVVHLPEAPSKPMFVTLASRDSRFKGSGAFLTSASTAWLPIPDPGASAPLLEEFRRHYVPGWLSVTGTLVEDTVDLTVEDLWRRLGGGDSQSDDIAMRLDATGIMVAPPEAFLPMMTTRVRGTNPTTTKKRRGQRVRSMSATCLGAFVQHGPSGSQPRLRLFIHLMADVDGIVGVFHTSLTLAKPLRAVLGLVFATDEKLRIQRVTRELFSRVETTPGTVRASHDDPAFASCYFEDMPLD